MNNKLDRREFVEKTLLGALGVSIFPSIVNGNIPSQTKKHAEYFINIFLQGGLSHTDSFDLKDHADSKSKFAKINTIVDDIKLCEHLSGLAKHADKMVLMNGMSTRNGAHEQSVYLNRTSYNKIGSITHPVLISWVAMSKDDGKFHTIPQSIVVGNDANYPFSGYMDKKYSPIPIQDPLKGLTDSFVKNHDQLTKRIQVLEKLNYDYNKVNNKSVKDYANFYDQTIKLLNSKELEVFDITKETTPLREKFGNNRFGQGALLIKRLMEKGGIKSAELVLGGFDNHTNIYTTLDKNLQILDQGLTALIDELSALGLMDKTLICINTDFGRTPRYKGSTNSPLNVNSGKDHWPVKYSTVLIGAGVRGGMVYGKSDEFGESVVDEQTTPQDLNATIAAAMGIDTAFKLISPEGRPFTVADRGVKIDKILA